MKIFYFTSTGNNLYLAKKFDAEIFSIPKLLKDDNLEFRDDCIGIIFPCYYFGTPRIVKKFLEQVKLHSEYIFGIMSYGNMSGAGVNHFNKIARKSGINISYLNEILMVDNYLPLFDMNKQSEEKSEEDIEQNITEIVEDIQARKKFVKTKNPMHQVNSFFAQIYYKLMIRNADKRFTVEDCCNSCGICEKVCPVNNIKVDQKPEFQHRCEECLACAHHCPQNAIRVKREKSAARFRNKNVSLQEIINSNN